MAAKAKEIQMQASTTHELSILFISHLIRTMQFAIVVECPSICNCSSLSTNATVPLLSFVLVPPQPHSVCALIIIAARHFLSFSRIFYFFSSPFLVSTFLFMQMFCNEHIIYFARKWVRMVSDTIISHYSKSLLNFDHVLSSGCHHLFVC